MKYILVITLTALMIILGKNVYAQEMNHEPNQGPNQGPVQEPAQEPNQGPNQGPSQGPSQGRPFGEIMQVAKPVLCNDADFLANFVEKDKRMSLWILGFTKNPMGAVESIINIYVNRNKEFIIAEFAQNGIGCIISTGDSFEYKGPDRGPEDKRFNDGTVNQFMTMKEK